MRDILDEKRSARAAAKAAVARMSFEEMQSCSLRACEAVIMHPVYQRAKCILVYKAMKSECDPSLIAERARFDGKRVLYPLCVGGSLELYEPLVADAFTRGAYGIMEPIPERGRRAEAGEADMLIIPGLAFDSCGMRLGRGKGFYDRLLSSSTGIKAGFCFDCQLIDRIPAEAHDISMDMLVAGGTIWTFC